MLDILNMILFAAHNVLIVINLFGWVFPNTRTLHLWTLSATLFSWCVMGMWRGFGYCLCTDWHFQIRRQLGIHRGETSYSEFLIHEISGIDISRQQADELTGGIMLAILVATAAVHMSARRKRRRQSAAFRKPL